MALVRNEIRALQSERVKTSATLEKRKKVYEKLTPGFFNILLLFAGLVTLIAFFYIIREMRIRIKYHKEFREPITRVKSFLCRVGTIHVCSISRPAGTTSKNQNFQRSVIVEV